MEDNTKILEAIEIRKEHKKGTSIEELTKRYNTNEYSIGLIIEHCIYPTKITKCLTERIKKQTGINKLNQLVKEQTTGLMAHSIERTERQTKKIIQKLKANNVIIITHDNKNINKAKKNIELSKRYFNIRGEENDTPKNLRGEQNDTGRGAINDTGRGVINDTGHIKERKKINNSLSKSLSLEMEKYWETEKSVIEEIEKRGKELGIKYKNRS